MMTAETGISSLLRGLPCSQGTPWGKDHDFLPSTHSPVHSAFWGLETRILLPSVRWRSTASLSTLEVLAQPRHILGRLRKGQAEKRRGRKIWVQIPAHHTGAGEPGHFA